MTAKPLPRTLASFAGLAQIPSHPSRAVLLLIDAQREYTTGKVPLAGIDAAVAEGARLLAFARAQHMPVIHAIHHGRRGGALFDPDGDGSAFIAPLAPVDGEAVLIKSLPNAFANTALADRIRDSGRAEIVIAGFATHMCVSATARAALDRGFRNTVVAAATATRDLPRACGAGVTPAEWIQQGTLAALADRFSVVIQDTAALSRAACAAA
ncbi:MAG TPA: cysteine hydrolase family protein [Steroidobacteraceae bacterium]|jgi:nicotinamidase-related amidase|nr:cysteine hydrolase family protein [Steroidobacteraceae bacterium]